MKRLVIGLVLGMILGTAASCFAGYFMSGSALQEARGGACGDMYVYGYVAGAHDLLAGLYPRTEHTQESIFRATIRRVLASPNPTKLPGAFFVAGALVDLSLITQDDLNRILPEGWRTKF